MSSSAAKDLLKSSAPVVLAGDYNVMPTDLDVYAPERWSDDALFRPGVETPIAALLSRAGRTRCALCTRVSGSTPSGNISGMPLPRDAGLRIDHLLLSPAIAGHLVAAAVDRGIRGRERVSDHAPVWIELAEAKGRSPRRRRERDA
jgi:exodeoxyribonuclease-3